jgi:23S rRNA (uracil1939-C5)-methyltransferase
LEMKKNDRFVLKIEDMGENGEGIGRLDGYIWFVKDAVIGDVIEAGVTKMKKQYGFARLIRVIEPSEYRTEERCPSARRCGGCQIQAVDYQEQLRLKEKKVYNNLKRIGGLSSLLLPGGEETTEQTKEETERNAVVMEPIIGMENPWRYRNKAQFPFGRNKDGRIVTGFYAGRTHDIVEQEDCLLGVEENREILSIIRNFMEEYKIEPYNEETHRGLVRHVLIRKGFQTGELMVCLVINGRKLPGQQALTEHLLEIPGMTSISLNVNQEKTNVILGKELINLWGEGHITDYIGAVQYRISPLSFYQVNPVQTERLYGTALEYAGLTGNETVWDLYCGIGTISLFLAQKAKQVYGVEIVPQAIDDARENARLNHMENVEFFVGKAEEVLPEQYERNQIYADVIVVDPPRKGCDEKCLETIVKMSPNRVVYVSCNSSTLARDVKYLEERGYRTERVRCVDMFPHSGHVETVVKLKKW